MAKLQPEPMPQQAPNDFRSFLPVAQPPTMPCPSQTRSAFLELPVEIRLQIYSCLVQLNPANHGNLSPSAPTPPPGHSPHFLQSLSSRLAIAVSSSGGFEHASVESHASSAESSSSSFSVSFLRGRGCGKMPSALLQTCRQVYTEARTIPWEENEFVFINWFSSGIFAARSFLSGLAPWQRGSLRWARIDVLARDLKTVPFVSGRPNEGQWSDLCGLWAGDITEGRRGGLWGLRLGIHGQIISQTTKNPASVGQDLGILNADAEWIKAIKRITSLKYLEVEIGDSEIDRISKSEFCVTLAEKLSTPGSQVIVILAEGVAEMYGRVAEGMDLVEPADDTGSGWLGS